MWYYYRIFSLKMTVRTLASLGFYLFDRILKKKKQKESMDTYDYSHNNKMHLREHAVFHYCDELHYYESHLRIFHAYFRYERKGDT